MKLVHRMVATICTLSILLILFITAIEAVVYWDKDYFQIEYERYGIAASIKMGEEALLEVTNEMMLYLKDDRDNLDIVTIVDGKSRAFFNEKEKAHMVDVKGLFLAGLMLRRVCIGLLLLGGCYLLWMQRAEVLLRGFRIGVCLCVCVGVSLAAVISINFFQAFQVFHKIFFRNELWVLDPKTDLLICIVPQPFFVDTAIRIGVFFILSLMILWGISTVLLRKMKRDRGMI